MMYSLSSRVKTGLSFSFLATFDSLFVSSHYWEVIYSACLAAHAAFTASVHSADGWAITEIGGIWADE